MSRFPFGCGWMRIREVICWLSTRSVVMFVVRLPFMLDTLNFGISKNTQLLSRDLNLTFQSQM